MKRIICLALALLFALAFAGCKKAESAAPQHDWGNEEMDPLEVPVVYATMTVKDFGVIELELYPEKAPETVCNFISLARQGFYDGLTFHRIVKDFMIQGGDPEGTGFGGPGYCITGEFAENGFNNDILHVRGVLSMARSDDYNSGGSQFFIMHEDQYGSQLDGKYAAFGKVTSGIEVVDAIAAVNVNSANNDRPYQKVVIESITVDAPILPEPEKLPAQ